MFVHNIHLKKKREKKNSKVYNYSDSPLSKFRFYLISLSTAESSINATSNILFCSVFTFSWNICLFFCFEPYVFVCFFLFSTVEFYVCFNEKYWSVQNIETLDLAIRNESETSTIFFSSFMQKPLGNFLCKT